MLLLQNPLLLVPSWVYLRCQEGQSRMSGTCLKALQLLVQSEGPSHAVLGLFSPRDSAKSVYSGCYSQHLAIQV